MYRKSKVRRDFCNPHVVRQVMSEPYNRGTARSAARSTAVPLFLVLLAISTDYSGAAHNSSLIICSFPKQISLSPL